MEEGQARIADADVTGSTDRARNPTAGRAHWRRIESSPACRGSRRGGPWPGGWPRRSRSAGRTAGRAGRRRRRRPTMQNSTTVQIAAVRRTARRRRSEGSVGDMATQLHDGHDEGQDRERGQGQADAPDCAGGGPWPPRRSRSAGSLTKSPSTAATAAQAQGPLGQQRREQHGQIEDGEGEQVARVARSGLDPIEAVLRSVRLARAAAAKRRARTRNNSRPGPTPPDRAARPGP